MSAASEEEDSETEEEFFEISDEEPAPLPAVVDLTKKRGYEEVYETCVSRADWVQKMRDADANDKGVYEKTPVGFHFATQRAFCLAKVSERIEADRANKRSRHTRLIGARMHSCIQHGVFCSRRLEEQSGIETQPRKKQCKRSFNLARKTPAPCVLCEHPPRCSFKACRLWSRAVSDWLRESDLVPIAVELDVAWHRIETSSRVDMICVNSSACSDADEMPPIVVVSIKTVGAGECAPKLAHRAPSVRLPKDVFGDIKVPDCEYSRHQLQLMLECITLTDSYKLLVQDAFVIYVNYSGTNDPRKVRVQEHTADSWWFDRLVMGARHRKEDEERLYALAIYMNSQYDFSKPPAQ